MYARLLKYVPAFLVAALTVTACGASNATSPTAPTEAQASKSAFTVEPDAIVPEFTPSAFCLPLRPFRLRFTVIVLTTEDLFLRGIRGHFVDRLGRRSFPQFAPAAASAPLPSNTGPVPMPSTPPVPIPGVGTSAIPVPGASGLDPLLIQGGISRTLPFSLAFGCDVVANGTMFLDFETSDRRGRHRTSQLTVPVVGD